MVEHELHIMNPTGLHAHPASMFCTIAGKYKCNVMLYFKGKEVNGKSPMSVMAGGIKMGSRVVLNCNGEDEADAIQALTVFIKNLEE